MDLSTLEITRSSASPEGSVKPSGASRDREKESSWALPGLLPPTPRQSVSRARRNWTAAIGAVERQVEELKKAPSLSRKKALERAQRQESRWRGEYLRLGGSLPVEKG